MPRCRSSRRFGGVVGEQRWRISERFFEEWLRDERTSPVRRGFRLLVHADGRLIGDAILVRHRGHPAQGLETPFGVHRLIVLRPLDP